VKRDVKTLLSVLVAAMQLPSPNMNAPLASPFDIRDDGSTLATFDVFDDLIPIVGGVPTNSFRWIEELSNRYFLL